MLLDKVVSSLITEQSGTDLNIIISRGFVILSLLIIEIYEVDLHPRRDVQPNFITKSFPVVSLLSKKPSTFKTFLCKSYLSLNPNLQL